MSMMPYDDLFHAYQTTLDFLRSWDVKVDRINGGYRVTNMLVSGKRRSTDYVDIRDAINAALNMATNQAQIY